MEGTDPGLAHANCEATRAAPAVMASQNRLLRMAAFRGFKVELLAWSSLRMIYANKYLYYFQFLNKDHFNGLVVSSIKMNDPLLQSEG